MPARKLRLCHEDDALRHEDDTMHVKTGGSDGGGSMDNLEKRVTNLEVDVKVIREDLTTLKVRSENFATKADVASIRTEMAELRGELKTEMAAQRGDIKTDMAVLRGELKAAILESQHVLLKEMESKFEKLSDKTRWKWSAIFIPLGVGIAGVLTTLLATYLSK